MTIRAFAVGIVFVTCAFVVFPSAFVELSDRARWPIWHSEVGNFLGWVLIAAGVVVAAYCSNLFRRRGGGTPVPVQPPTRLVTTGLYTYSRNPIYVADTMILLGIFLVNGHAGLLLYAALFLAVAHALVVLHEEPVLRRRFGADFDRWAAHVPRWIGWR